LRERSALQSPNPTGAQIRQLERIVDYYLSQLTNPKFQDDLPRKVTERFLKEDLYGSKTTIPARDLMHEHLLKRAPELLHHPDPLVRFNLLALVVQLSTKPGTLQGREETPAVPYNPIYKLFIQALTDPDQVLECRILAARGLARVCRDGENAPSSPEKSDIANALVQTLAQTPPSMDDGVSWFRRKMIEALGYVDRIDNSEGQPVVVETLLEVISDRREEWVNRACAAKSITQLPYSGQTNVSLIAYEIAALLEQMVKAYEEAPSAPYWHHAFVRIYLAFRPEFPRQATERRWGLLYEMKRPGLGAHANYVENAWNVVFPIVRPFVEKKLDLVPAADLQALQQWLAQNRPADLHVVPNGRLFDKTVQEPSNGSN
jgi:hypothetical protein